MSTPGVLGNLRAVSIHLCDLEVPLHAVTHRFNNYVNAYANDIWNGKWVQNQACVLASVLEGHVQSMWIVFEVFKQAQLSYERLKEAQFSSVQSRLSSVLLDKAKSVFIGVVENVSVYN